MLESLARIHRWIIVLDAQRRILWMSEGLRELSGVGELALGVDARNFLAKLPRPEQIFPLRSNMRARSYLTGAPLELRVADGRAIPVDIDLVRVEDGDSDLMIAIATEHVATGDRADASLLDALPDAVLAVDAGGVVRRVNHAARGCSKRPQTSCLARPLTALLAKGVEEIESLAEALSGSAREATCELELRGPSGRVRSLAVTVAPLSGGARAVVLRDATEERQALARLRKANEELEHCVGALAHDLRSPLVGLLGFSRLLRQDYEDSLDDTGPPLPGPHRAGGAARWKRWSTTCSSSRGSARRASARRWSTRARCCCSCARSSSRASRRRASSSRCPRASCPACSAIARGSIRCSRT